MVIFKDKIYLSRIPQILFGTYIIKSVNGVSQKGRTYYTASLTLFIKMKNYF